MNEPQSHDEEHPESVNNPEDSGEESLTDDNLSDTEDNEQGDNLSAEDSSEASEPTSTTGHWKSLVEEIGATAAPEEARRHAAREVPASQEKPKREAAKPRTAPPAPGRKHWAGLAGELGVDFPDLPEDEEKPAAAEAEASEDDSGTAKPKSFSSQVIPVAPEDLIEDTPAAVSEMLDEVERPDLFGSGIEPELDDAEEEAEEEFAEDDSAIAEAEPVEHEAHSASDDDEIVYAEVIDVPDGESRERSEEGDGGDNDREDDEEEDRPRRRRGRRRGRRRRRSESRDAESRERDADDDERDDIDDDLDEDDGPDGRDSETDEEESGDDDDRPRRRRGRRDSRSRGVDGKRDYKFPMWSEAIDLLVTKNMEGRKSSKGDGGSRRGGRRRR